MEAEYSEQRYKVAGHIFEVKYPSKLALTRMLEPYTDFKANDEECEALFSLSVSIDDNCPECGELIQIFNDEPPFLWTFRNVNSTEQDALCFGYSFDKTKPCAILEFEDAHNWQKGRLHIKSNNRTEAEMAINNSLMLMYAYNAGMHDTLLLHASAPMKDGKGYVFLAKSGTGKSTHSRMWLENIEGCELLNDDNPVVRFEHGKAMLYGSPWSGKTPCYKNKSVELGGIVRIIRAPYNKATALNMFQAFASLMPSCSSMRWNSKWTAVQEKTIEKVIMCTNSWNMECLPDAEAAKVCYAHASNTKKTEK